MALIDDSGARTIMASFDSTEALTPMQRDNLPDRYQYVWAAVFAAAQDRYVIECAKSGFSADDTQEAETYADVAVITLAKSEHASDGR